MAGPPALLTTALLLRPCRYTVSATATMVGGAVVPASNNVPLQMPASNAPTLITAVPTGPTGGASTAAPPPGVNYQAVRSMGKVWGAAGGAGCRG